MDIPEPPDDFGQKYAEAWSSQRSESVADFYADGGSLCVNDDEPAVGRSEIAEAAREWMTAFPDLEVTCDRFAREADEFRWYWTMKGTHLGPGGGGNRIVISGFEAIDFNPSGKIRSARGYFDEDDYRRQLLGGPRGTVSSRRAHS